MMTEAPMANPIQQFGVDQTEDQWSAGAQAEGSSCSSAGRAGCG